MQDDATEGTKNVSEQAETCLGLMPQHAQMLCESKICDEVAKARGYRSIKTKSELLTKGYSASQRNPPTLFIPIWSVTDDKTPALHHHRPDSPRVLKEKTVKYEFPFDSKMVIDVHPFHRKKVRDPSIPLLITEGVKKADSATSAGLVCIAVVGTWNWRGTNEFDGKTTLPDLDEIAWKDKNDQPRLVYICYDSDVMLKPSVYMALARFSGVLNKRGAKLAYIYLPHGPDGAKWGLDDYLAAGHSTDELLALATTELRRPPETEEEAEVRLPYQETEQGIFWLKDTPNGPVQTPLTNFTARIVADLIADDGAETTHEYRIEARRGERHKTFSIPAASFDALGWPSEHLGASAYVYAGFGLKDHARVAIRFLSGEPGEQRVFTHTGWRRLESEKWVYLHANGAIGAEEADGIAVRLSGTLQRYALPPVPDPEALQQAISACLLLLDLAPDRITFPVLGSVFRAALGTADFSLAIAGKTGAFKSELTSLAQRFYGKGMDRRNLPGSWSSTENALEELAFCVKDALLCIDDFIPTPADAQRLHAKADRVLRAQGNGSGRQRMRRDGSLRPERPPRGLIVSTGEDIPQGQSLKARQFIIEVNPGDIPSECLTDCQHDAAAGRYANCMSAFLAWIAPNYEQMRADMPGQLEDLRNKAALGMHRRTPGMVADLAFGLNQFLTFAQAVGGITQIEANQLAQRARQALTDAANGQASHLQASEPTTRFVELLQAALSSGRAFVASSAGKCPYEPEAWGWRRRETGDGNTESMPQGEKIGYTDGEDLYLIPDVSYSVAKKLGADGEGFAMTPTTLWKRLNEAGYLASTDKKRETLKIRRTLESKVQDVLHFRAETFISEKPDKPDNSE